MKMSCSRVTTVCLLSTALVLFGACGSDSSSTTPTPDTTVQPDTAPPAPKCEQGLAEYNGQCCTCSPPKDCEAGIDNMLSGIASLANSSLQGSIDDGSVNVIAEMSADWKTTDQFSLRMYTADLAEGDEECNVTTGACNWQLSLSALSDDCSALIAFDNAKITDGKLTAGGPDGVFQLTLPIAGFELVLMVSRARIEADVTLSDEGDVTSINGILGGAIPKASLVDAVNALDPESLPISKDVVLNILSNVIQEDMDVLDADGNPGTDGTMDASSVSLLFEAIPGTITGVESAAMPVSDSLCTQYCQLATDNCSDGNVIDFGTDGCEAACSSMTQGALETDENDTLTGPTGGDSIACRIYHLTAAADAPETHCPHGNVAGGNDTAGFPCTGDVPVALPPAKGCTEPPTTFGPAFRIYSLQLGANGMSGEGLDIDGVCVDMATPDATPASE